MTRAEILNEVVPLLTPEGNLRLGQGFKMPAKKPNAEIVLQLKAKHQLSAFTITDPLWSEKISKKDAKRFNRRLAMESVQEIAIQTWLLTQNYESYVVQVGRRSKQWWKARPDKKPIVMPILFNQQEHDDDCYDPDNDDWEESNCTCSMVQLQMLELRVEWYPEPETLKKQKHHN